jgi:hypothetical protein
MSSEQDGRAALVYVHDGRYAVCIVRPVDGAWLGRAGGSGPWRPMGRNVYRTYVFSGALVVQVADDVDRVRLDVDGGVFEADAQGGYAVLWFPAAQDDLIGSSVVTAYDADGNVLRQGGI